MKHAFGFDQLDRKLASLEKAIPLDRQRDAARAGGRVLRDAARALAPERSGLLRRRISVVDAKGVTLQGGAAPSDTLVIVGPMGSTPDGDVPYAHDVEYGQLYWPGQPYLRPALAAQRDTAVGVVVSRLRADILAAVQ
ncbi:MAG: hypothetical protein FJ335_07520 [Sphingomonadales bacterium]|nr:hypothetical protein [Sphingomonadales bacterium]